MCSLTARMRWASLLLALCISLPACWVLTPEKHDYTSPTGPPPLHTQTSIRPPSLDLAFPWPGVDSTAAPASSLGGEFLDNYHTCGPMIRSADDRFSSRVAFAEQVSGRQFTPTDYNVGCSRGASVTTASRGASDFPHGTVSTKEERNCDQK